jgi:ZIP family zinc transporter
MDMAAAAGWGMVAASSLVIGSLLMFWLQPSKRIIGLIMAFGAGTLISAIAYDLVGDAMDSNASSLLAAGLALGALTFFIGDYWIDGIGGARRKRSSGVAGESGSLGIFLGTLLDGIPESFILGASLVAGSVSFPFLLAVFISNLPEAMAATVGLHATGWSKQRIIGIWLAVVAVAAVAAVFGYLLFSLREMPGVLVKGFAAGALLAMLADTMMPEAFEHGGKAVGLLTVLGFATAIALDMLG